MSSNKRLKKRSGNIGMFRFFSSSLSTRLFNSNSRLTISFLHESKIWEGISFGALSIFDWIFETSSSNLSRLFISLINYHLFNNLSTIKQQSRSICSERFSIFVFLKQSTIEYLCNLVIITVIVHSVMGAVRLKTL